MSKMPAKKKSCFQITSVTSAQGSGSLADDTESLDGDPDESRTDDVSSEVFAVSRGEGPGQQAGTVRSSSEETLNNAGSPGTVSPTPQQAPAAPATCSSRFRVIKLDHGSGEPYRRGRWTCLEYYERETDTIRHGHAASDPSGERDSGLGASQVGLEPLADGPVSHLSQAPQQQHFLIGQQQPQAGAGPQHAQHSGQHMVAQGQAHTGHNGKVGPKGMAAPQLSGSAGHNGKAAVSQAQQFTYFQPQAQRNPTQAPVTQTDYIRNVNVPHTQGTTNTPISAAPNLPLGQSNSAGRAQVLGPGGDSGVQGSGLSHVAQPATSHPAVTLQSGGVVQTGVASAGLVQSKLVTQHQPTGASTGMTMPSGHHTTSFVAHNVPVAASSASVFVVSSIASTIANMPNDPLTVVQSQQGSHTTVTRSASLVQPIGLPELVNSHMPLPNANHFHQHTFAQTDDRRKSEPLPQPPSSLIADHTPFMKPPILDSFTNPLHLPATTPMNSLTRSVFGISIPVDGDEDSVSSASVVAIDNKIEQAMDLVKSHLMFAVREEVEVLKEQIKELIEKNSTLERENTLLKSLTNNDHLVQLSTQSSSLSNTSQQKTVMAQKLQTTQPSQPPNVSSA